MARELIRFRRPIRCCGRKRLNAGLLVIGNGDYGRLFELAFQQFRIDDFHFLVQVQDYGHLGLKLLVPAFHVVTDLVWTNLALRQNPVQPGSAQFGQTPMTGFETMLPHVPLKQRISPKLVGVAKFLRLLAGTVQNPRNGVIRNPPTLARSRQISQRRFQSELKKLTSAQRDGMAVNAVAAGHGAVALAAGQIQKYPRMQRLPLRPTAGTPRTLQFFLFIRGKNQPLPLRCEWHKPFSHENVLIV